MRILVPILFLLTVLHTSAAAQGTAPAGPADGDEVLVPAAVGTIVRGYIQDTTGQAVVGEVQLAGSSPDDLFTYWVGYDGQQYLGFDVFREVWRPGPAEYIRATLTFQAGTIEGWLRSFGGMVDRDFFFGLDGAVYQRFYCEVGGEVVYSYFMHAATGQRSDTLELLNQVVGDPGLVQIILAQQAAQQEKYLAGFPQRDESYPRWREFGNILPEELPTLVSWGAPAAGLERQLPEGQPSLLELIEEEVGPLNPEQAEPEETEEAPAGDGDSAETDAGAEPGDG
jgi:hypothetical protein